MNHIQKINRLIVVIIAIQLLVSCNKENVILPVNPPKLNTLKLSDINQICDNKIGCITTLQSGGEIVSELGTRVIEKGICYGLKNPPTIFDNKIIDASSNNKFTLKITGLISDSVYYFRAYASTNTGLYYGNVIAYNSKSIDYDGNVYKTITIGTQTWMAENLKVTHFRNGDVIPVSEDKSKWSELTSAAYSKFNNKENNAATYGLLYNFYAVSDSRNICPEGWHIPTEAEWKELIEYLGGDSIAGGILKEQGNSHWMSPNTMATNDFQFNAIPGGYRSAGGDFQGLGLIANWWSTSSADEFIAFNYAVSYNRSTINMRGSDKKMGLSIRCIRD